MGEPVSIGGESQSQWEAGSWGQDMLSRPARKDVSRFEKTRTKSGGRKIEERSRILKNRLWCN